MWLADEAIRERLAAWRAAADAHHIALCHRPGGLAVRAPATALPMRLDAVMDNALKFTPGPGRVEIDTRRCGDQVGSLSGTPAPASPARNSVGPPTGSGAARRDQNVPGSGLGLAIVQRTVRAAGGALRLEQHPDGGLRVVLTLPAADPPAGQESGTVAADGQESAIDR